MEVSAVPMMMVEMMVVQVMLVVMPVLIIIHWPLKEHYISELHIYLE